MQVSPRYGICSTRSNVTLLVLLAIMVPVVQPAIAQLSSTDIAALPERGRQEGWTFTVGDNPATQYSLQQLCGVVEPPDWRANGRFDPCTPQRSQPATYDWRTQGVLTPIRNQGGCGSCWAFGLIGAVEANIALGQGIMTDLSEQWLVSCCGLGGCEGDWPGNAANFCLANGVYRDSCNGYGAVLESSFPYVARDATCNCPYNHPYCLTDWAYIGPQWSVPTVSQLKQAILDHGPITVCVNASAAFQGYTGGIFNASDTSTINHCTVLVGWDDNQGPGGVWFMRNSWGSGWGEQGYMRITYGCCLIGYGALYVDFPRCTMPRFTQPLSNTDGCVGGSVSLSVAVDAPAPAYQWRMDTTNLVDDGVHIFGATTPTLTIVNLTKSDISDRYNCLVTNTAEGCSARSGYAIVYVYDPAAFTSQPTSQTIAEFQTIAFAATATGEEPLSYQWRHNGVNLSNGGNITGATTTGLVIWNAEAPQAGYYDCIVSNGCGPVASTAAHLTINTGYGAGRGDLNCDGTVNFRDINAFVLALSAGEWGYYDSYGDCHWYNGDVNADGIVDFKDINSFVVLLSGG